MICPKCQHTKTIVTDTRGRNAHTTLRRMRRCAQCDHRFATMETTGADDRIALANAAMAVRGEIGHMTILFHQLETLLKKLEG